MTLLVYCDGAVEPRNPGGWGVGGWVIGRGSTVAVPYEELHKGAVDLGEYPEMTNNIAEYGAVIGALKQLVKMKLWRERVVIRTDSQLIVNQIKGNWGTAMPHLVQLRDEARTLVKMFDAGVTFEWIPRSENKKADEMSRSLYHGRMAPGLPEPDYDRPRPRRKK